MEDAMGKTIFISSVNELARAEAIRRQREYAEIANRIDPPGILSWRKTKQAFRERMERIEKVKPGFTDFYWEYKKEQEYQRNKGLLLEGLGCIVGATVTEVPKATGEFFVGKHGIFK
jgi:hypothetical protein